jgi:hypothetical protein
MSTHVLEKEELPGWTETSIKSKDVVTIARIKVINCGE